MRALADYHGHRIEVEAVAVDKRWNASVRIRRALSQEEPHVDLVTCLKLTAESAERTGEIWAERCADLNAPEGRQ